MYKEKKNMVMGMKWAQGSHFRKEKLTVMIQTYRSPSTILPCLVANVETIVSCIWTQQVKN